jgi:hypothetical protein
VNARLFNPTPSVTRTVPQLTLVPNVPDSIKVSPAVSGRMVVSKEAEGAAARSGLPAIGCQIPIATA